MSLRLRQYARALTFSLARALAPEIRLNIQAPGYVRTPWLVAAHGADGAADLEKRFAELSRFMQQLRKPSQVGDAATSLTDRERLLDVRRHVEISAERYDHTTGELRATYRTLGEKSGGESQELVAFIVGSALRFRLGDEMRSRPRFAPAWD